MKQPVGCENVHEIREKKSVRLVHGSMIHVMSLQGSQMKSVMEKIIAVMGLLMCDVIVLLQTLQ